MGRYYDFYSASEKYLQSQRVVCLFGILKGTVFVSF